MEMINVENDLLSVLSKGSNKFSQGQRIIAKYILNNYDKAAFMTAGRLGKIVGVSESTVVRFAALMGYDGYPKMQRALQEMLRMRFTSVQRIALTQDMPAADVLPMVLKRDVHNIQTALEDIDADTFARVTQDMVNAREIYVLGLRSSAPLAEFFGHYLRYIFPHVHVIGDGVAHVMEDLVRMQAEDLLFAMSFPRYSSRTVEAVQYAKKRGARIVALTDTMISPIASLSDHVLIAGSDMALFADSLVAPLSVINALIVALGLAKKDEVSDYLNTLESVWDATETYFDRPAEEV